jgi:ABC-type transport system substrate-binding protein
VPTAAEHNKYRVNGLYDGLVPQSGSSDDADYFVFRDYHSQGNPNGRQAFPDPRIDQLGLAQKQELDLEKRRALLKEFQMFMAGWMATIPGRHLYTQFSFRWPWLRNNNLRHHVRQLGEPGLAAGRFPGTGRPSPLARP